MDAELKSLKINRDRPGKKRSGATKWIVAGVLLAVLLVAPLLVFAGQVLGQPMDLAFTSFEVVSIVLATVITRELIQDGRANWFEGVLLVAAYAILAIGFFHLPE